MVSASTPTRSHTQSTRSTEGSGQTTGKMDSVFCSSEMAALTWDSGAIISDRASEWCLTLRAKAFLAPCHHIAMKASGWRMFHTGLGSKRRETLFIAAAFNMLAGISLARSCRVARQEWQDAVCCRVLVGVPWPTSWTRSSPQAMIGFILISWLRLQLTRRRTPCLLRHRRLTSVGGQLLEPHCQQWLLAGTFWTVRSQKQSPQGNLLVRNPQTALPHLRSARGKPNQQQQLGKGSVR
mmetsp:Transcript_32385/g.58080  ORF Transcript_32385/g.58080 Transcript_32385/m.58080 type:complete len:238 (-) Transcript_32385:895-1608(-)